MHNGKSVKDQPKKRVQTGIRGHINITSTSSYYYFFFLKTINPAIISEEKAIAP